MKGRSAEQIRELSISQRLSLLRHLVFRAESGFSVGTDLLPAEGGVLDLRHTFTRSVGKELYTGQDPKNKNGQVTLKGIIQAFRTGLMMRQRGICPDLYMAANLHRARITARILSFCTGKDGLYISEPLLTLERRFGERYEGRSRRDISKEERLLMQALHPSSWHLETGFESTGMFLLRGAASLMVYDQVYQEAMKYTQSPWIVFVTHGGVLDAQDIILRKHLANNPEFIAMHYSSFKPGILLPRPYVNLESDKDKYPVPALKANPLDGFVIPGRVLSSLRSTHTSRERSPNMYRPLSQTVSSLGLGSTEGYREFEEFNFLYNFVINGQGQIHNISSFVRDQASSSSTMEALIACSRHPTIEAFMPLALDEIGSELVTKLHLLQ